MATVWILGAGFSKSLGGPLMQDLFTGSLLRRVDAQLQERGITVGSRFRDVHDHYAHKEDGATWTIRPNALWSNAEEYLDILEAADAPNADATTVKLAGTQNRAQLELYAKEARRYLAAACHHFVPDGDAPKNERWEPFRRWGKNLVGERDTIISFNYDLVVERVTGAEHLSVPLPWAYDLPAHEKKGKDNEKPKPRLLKLHGSLNWASERRIAPGEVTSSETSPREVDTYDSLRAGHYFHLGLPGPSKLELSSTYEQIWSEAERALRVADTIVLVGYRFAETDNEAKRRLLGKIKENRARKLTIRVVLGPDTGGPDTRRVMGMLAWALRRRGCVTPGEARTTSSINTDNEDHVAVLDAAPMYAQDFLSVVERGHLNQW